ncbi:hypothetical protein, conserved [Eimeria acervulina]|uniref:Uncharacterized protein n=1 Tax=Eimeria acervulina TaxID=5801 RepID=U6GVC1_EIMAC|nr:hypothetical protein, conserved [Eimeria acervulina]CDI84125.1 hypothetical protein, conserved [Eimeria acervulina]
MYELQRQLVSAQPLQPRHWEDQQGQSGLYERLLWHQQWSGLPWKQQQHQQAWITQQQQQFLLQQHARFTGTQLYQSWASPVERQHVMQQQEQQLLEQQSNKRVTLGQSQQQERQQQEQDVRPQDQRKQQHAKRKRKREQQEESERLDEQLQPPQRADARGTPFREKAWLPPNFPSPQTPQPSISQQPLQSSVAAPAAGPSTSMRLSTQVIPGPTQTALATTPTGNDAGSPWVKAAAARPAGAAAAAACGERNGDSSSVASTGAKTGEGMEVPTLSSLLGGASSEDAGTAAAASGVAHATNVCIETPAITEALGANESVAENLLGHPFVRLPRRMVEQSHPNFQIDFKRAVTIVPPPRYAMPLLHKAHDLLSLQRLFPHQMKQLVTVAEELVAHAMRYHRQDLSAHINCRAVERLGVRFLLLDCVVSACIVLGQEAKGEHWEVFTKSISHAVPLWTPRGKLTPRQASNLSLVMDLSSGIQILKTGRRPTPASLVKVKRMLFCSTFSPLRMVSGDFEPWQRDDISGSEGP